MKKRMISLLLAVCCLMLLSGCTAQPPESIVLHDPADPAQLVSPDAEKLPADQISAVLYFRFSDTAYLAGEEREIRINKDETAEMALVQALVAGPSTTHSSLSPLFPQGTKVLAVSRQEDTLFVTFNEALMSHYSDEPGDVTKEPWKTESPLRRRLCMDALADILTEAGLCTRVQVLVYREKVQGTSMRLTNGYFSVSQDESIAPPLVRSEETLLTPHNAASALLTAWMTQDWEALLSFTGSAGKPAEQTALMEFSAAKVLTGFQLSHGNVSPDGQTAVVSADLTLQRQGQDFSLTGYPLYLQREMGLWKISYDRLSALMNQD